MADYEMLTQLLELPQVQVTHWQLVGRDRFNLFVESTVAAAVCPECGHLSTTVHEVSEPQMVRDLPIWQRRCWLRYAPRRFACSSCPRTFVERVAWREPGRDYTVRYEQYLYERARREPISDIAHDERLSQDIVQGIFERWAKKESPRGATRR